ncbi:MAG: thiol oxidoreductase [Acidobacteria bacterium]|nr:MAG: thiol oxidoreductase [Acidobacteriota bacterium]REK04499.1 MAG: thiol oxidoreductase [Acidobacteriota bacterium]
MLRSTDSPSALRCPAVFARPIGGPARGLRAALLCAAACLLFLTSTLLAQSSIGREVSMPSRLADGQEYEVSVPQLFAIGGQLFDARWTDQEGGGRPLTKGTGAPLSDPSNPLHFPRNFNRLSAPDANGCVSCHNLPASGGGGDFTTNVFVLAQRFDSINFGDLSLDPTVDGFDESGNPITLSSVANSRATVGMNGSGYIEMLARQMTDELVAIRAAMQPGESRELIAKGVSFGTLHRNPSGTFDTSDVVGLPAPSLGENPSLVIMPFHQAGAVVSLRQFSNNAMNHHHGIQPDERFGDDLDPDGDTFVNEMSRAEVTAISVYQAALSAPGRMIPRVPAIEQAVLLGEQTFDAVGCTRCHVSALPLEDFGWYFSEPNPYNPPGNLQFGEAEPLYVNLNSDVLPAPRLRERDGVTWVPAFTDLKLHDITSGPDDPNREVLNMHYPAGSDEFFGGNGRFLTKKLWGAANEPPYYHHGLYTTMRQAIHAHAGEAEAERLAFEALTEHERDAVIEFLKTLQVLPPGVTSRFVDENYQPRRWPPAGQETPLLDRSDLTGWSVPGQ